MNVVIHHNDKLETVDISNINNTSIRERISGAPKKTKVTFRNADTGEIIQERENKVVITGGQLNAMYAWGLPATVEFPTYNSEMNLDNSEPIDPKNNPVICLFCVSDSGCGATPKDIYIPSYTGRIKPAPADTMSTRDFTSDMIMPFRWVDDTDDLPVELRDYYFGRKAYPNLGKIGYFFKKFDTQPQLHLIYSDGTPISDAMYNIESDQAAECYVNTRLRITRLDFRDYFEDVLGWDKGRISSLSLLYGWYDDEIDDYIWYQDVTPYSLLYFSYINMVDTTLAVDIEYSIYY